MNRKYLLNPHLNAQKIQNMKYSDIIMPCSTRNEKIEEFQVEMIDSFVNNTPDECKLWMIEKWGRC